jgi:phosphatidylethanolamine-binding protein (PEBP) family uncharacterized protein
MTPHFPNPPRSSRREEALNRLSGLTSTAATFGIVATLLLAADQNTAAHTIDHHDVIPHLEMPKVEFTTIPGNRLVLGKKDGKLQALNTVAVVPVARVAAIGSTPLPSASARLMQSAFGAFPKVKTRSDGRHFYIESDSIPDHNMMVGITAWQQQVPIPQPYTGDNAWQIPLNPVPARNPLSAKNNFFRGAIALAVNGIPIFNPIKNNGVTDTFTAGELDQWGGHCGRADDYHYHIAPVHLQNQVGRGKPVAWALDGYPIYGYTEANGATALNLDRLNGHDHGTGYHYHATKTYPYLNGGFHGEVQNSGGQVSPQPRAAGVRSYTPPMRGAKITGFSGNLQTGYSLKYDVSGRTGYVNYKVAANRSVEFTFIDTSGSSKTENYTPRNRGSGGGREGGTRQGGGRGGDRNRAGEREDKRGSENREVNEDEILQFFQGGDRPTPARPRRSENSASSNQSAQAGQERPRPGGGDRGGRQGGGGRGGDPILAALDSNGDGELTRDELTNAAAALRKLDKNGDGELTREETRGQGGGGGRGGDREGRGPGGGREQGGRPPTDRGAARPAGNPSASTATPYLINPKRSGNFKLTSPAVAENGPLPKEYNGDGAGATLPLEWNGAPAGTKSFALVMDHLARGPEIKCYWTIWGISPSVTGLPKNVRGVGQLGATWKRGETYIAPHSQGGGAKTYTLHVYALSKVPQFSQPPGEVTREILLAAIKDSILDSADLNVIYTASGDGERRGAGGPGGNRGRSPNRQRQQPTGL